MINMGQPQDVRPGRRGVTLTQKNIVEEMENLIGKTVSISYTVDEFLSVTAGKVSGINIEAGSKPNAYEPFVYELFFEHKSEPYPVRPDNSIVSIFILSD